MIVLSYFLLLYRLPWIYSSGKKVEQEQRTEAEAMSRSAILLPPILFYQREQTAGEGIPSLSSGNHLDALES